ncbi:DUF1289 domain-containing protein [Methylomonas sp. AM2-LC]|uniref:DUF1289 domain-containing protein n=1 Tax=Methylomonas sp. AM2-LC TaxID=3153301 RepID=UPI003267122D
MTEIGTVIQSPCVRNCCLNEEDICLGCYRHVDEICQWLAADPQMRKKILNQAAQRKMHYLRISKGLMSVMPTINK